ncbi:MAG: hypothetical protein KC776_42475 [Myxococcales bacterium]|nr:hypothetical protein [Myxococcales bacterium]MCB9578149.1 hypothetical protein [Polyangiaceae bacterium]
MHPASDTHRVVAIDMGYGHLRPAHALADALGSEVLHADRPPLASTRDQQQWDYVRRYYEAISRASRWPLLGAPMRGLLDSITDIRDLYGERDQSSPNAGVQILERMIRSGLGKALVEDLSADDAILVTTFYMPAIAADRRGYDRIYCIVTDSDINRVWAPIDPVNTRITYLVPTQHTRRRLRAYGVPEERVRVTGFPLPHELVGGPDMHVAKRNLATRLVRLDPTGVFRNELRHTIPHFLGAMPIRDDGPVLLTFAVGGAGAQADLPRFALPGLRGLIADGRLEVALVAGVRPEVQASLQSAVEEAGLERHLGGAIRILLEPTFEEYLRRFNELLARTDILWTKPSEMTFFAGLGLPLIFSPAVGTHERYNRRWAREQGAGLKQRNPHYLPERLKDWLKDGTLAASAWNGFLRAPRFGLYETLEAIGAHDALRRLSGPQQLAQAS